MSENMTSQTQPSILTLSNDIPPGHYWANEVYADPTAPGVLRNGACEIVTITAPVNWRRKMQRLIMGRHWTDTLAKVVAGPNQYWRLWRIPEPPKEIML